jgi:hypothetical protein
MTMASLSRPLRILRAAALMLALAPAALAQQTAGNIDGRKDERGNIFEAPRKRVGDFGKDAALAGNRSAAVLQAALPNSRSFTVHALRKIAPR